MVKYKVLTAEELITCNGGYAQEKKVDLLGGNVVPFTDPKDLLKWW